MAKAREPVFDGKRYLGGAPVVLPLIFIPDNQVYYCPVLNCNSAHLDMFPASSLLPPNSAPFLPAYADAVQERGCNYLPFTSDEWFTLKATLPPEQYEATRLRWVSSPSYIFPITLSGVLLCADIIALALSCSIVEI